MAWLTRFSWIIGSCDPVELVIVGLANSGKTTLMRQIKPKDIKMEQLSPLIPLAESALRFEYKSLRFACFNLTDQSGFGNPWEDLYKECKGIIFVIDSANRANSLAVQVHIHKLTQHPLLKQRRVPILILANKMDVATSVSQYQLIDLLRLNDIKDKPWSVFSTDALTGEGLGDALDWLAFQLKRSG